LYNSDYLKKSISKKFDFIIINPPYVRHELLKKKYKKHISEYLEKRFKFKINKQCNLYVYFILKSLLELKDNGICTFIVYDAIEYTRYGKELLKIIKMNCKILKSYNLKTPFNEVLIDAKVIIVKKKNKKNLNEIKNKKNHDGLISISKLANVKRGIGLISKKVFKASKNDIFFNLSKAIILNARNISTTKNKIIPGRAYLFNKSEFIPKKLIVMLRNSYEKQHKKKLKILTHHIKTGPIIFNYYFRKKIYFHLNDRNFPVSDNFYIVEPKRFSIKAFNILLNSTAFKRKVLLNSRNQGSGLRKIQLYEFNQIMMPDFNKLNYKKIKQLEKKIIIKQKNEELINKIVNTSL